MKRKDRKKGEQGFTLVEVIAVLVILGVLAAVAAPRYFSMQAQARAKAAEAAIAEAKGRISQTGAQYLLNNGTFPASTYYTSGVVGSDAGDFTFATAGTADTVNITATGVAGGPAGGASATGSMLRPGVTS